MPKRHLVVLFFAFIISVASYQVASRNRLASLLTDATNLMVNEGYYPVDEDQLLVSAMEGMLKNVDPFSAFQYGDRAIERDEFLNQAYAGLGIRIRREPDSKLIRIVLPMFGSPAAEAGIQAGDRIIKIDGQSVAELPTSDDIEKRIKGPEGTVVELDILRTESDETKKTIHLSVERRSIPTPAVVGDRPDDQGSWHFHLEAYPRIGYIRILQFGMRTADEVREALQQVDGNVDSLIIDLRENPGGLLPAAVDISDQFIASPGKTIVSIKDRNGVAEETYVSTAGTTLKKTIPIVVMVNQNSASASEIVSACLQDYNLATIVGQRSFGKGTVQTQFALPRPNTKLTLTTASYWRPSGENIHRLRWRPDSKTAPPESVQEQWGVSPTAEFSIPLNQRDSTILYFLYENRQLGIPESEIDPSVKKAIDGIGSRTDANVVSDENDDESTTSFPNRVQWDDPRSLVERDPQLKKAIEFLTSETEIDSQKDSLQDRQNE